MWGLNLQPGGQESHILPTVPARCPTSNFSSEIERNEESLSPLQVKTLDKLQTNGFLKFIKELRSQSKLT